MATYLSLKGIMLWSEDYKKLADWYVEKFGFTVGSQSTDPTDTGISLVVGDSFIWCGYHSEVHGQSKDPYRIMFNIDVDSVSAAFHELSNKGVEFIALPFKVPNTSNRWCATFKDIDGNIGQLFGEN